MDLARAVTALCGLAVLVAIAFATWAVRWARQMRIKVERIESKVEGCPKDAKPATCSRLHVADIPDDWLPPSRRLRAKAPADDDPPFPTR